MHLFQGCLLLAALAAASGCDRQPADPKQGKHPADTSQAALVKDKARTEKLGSEPLHEVATTALLALPASPPPPHHYGQDAQAHGRAGVVTSVDSSATQAGIEILNAGGNAVDAAVATAFALAVTHPSAGNIGGGGFLLLKLGGTVEAVDFREDSPAALTQERFWKMIHAGGKGPASVGVPGTVAGLYMAHSRHGKLPWSAVVLPAERLAKEGYIIGERQVKTIGWAQADLLRDKVALSAFFPRGPAPRAGARILRPRLGLALERIRLLGPSGFYEGETARDLVSSLGPDGLLTETDLRGYKARLRTPLSFDFGAYRVITMPAPSAGGVALAQNLLILDALDVSQTAPDSPERLHLIVEASRRAQAERQLFVMSPDLQSGSEQALATRRALDPQTWLKAHPIDPKRPTLSSSLHKDFAVVDREPEHTTHLSVIDKDGGLVSCTVTLSGSFGARIFSKETGIVFNNSTASFSGVGVNTPRPGSRTTSSMAPTLALLHDGAALVLGSPGGDTIPSTITQTFLRLALDGAGLSAAVNAPRFHQGFAPQGVSLELSRPLTSAQKDALRAVGHTFAPSRSTIGDANIAAYEDGVAYAVADPREGGLAAAATEGQSQGPSPTPEVPRR